ncbi:MAG TPA: hypothetical protein VLX58_08340 [Bryobacteraceae bacterium]|nr:hypothetical protein [Bryobacteraceae bacterium]
MPAVALKVAVVDPAETTTDEATTTEELLLLRPTVVPPVGAAAVRDTVQELAAPEGIVPGVQVRPARLGGAAWMVSVADRVAPVDAAEMIAVCVVVTEVVVTMNALLVRPAETVISAGAGAAELLLDIVTTVPPAGAAETRFTVQDVFAPPIRVLGVQTIEETAGSTIVVRVSEKVFETLASVAVMVTVVLLDTDEVVTVKLAVEEPELTVTEEGTEATELELLASDTLVLLEALPLNVTVHVEVAGGVTLAGLHERFDSVGAAGVRVSEKVFETLASVAVMVTVVLLDTDEVVTVKLAVEEPELTVTEEGTEATELALLASDTLVLLEALPLNVTVQVEVAGGVTLAGLHKRFDSVGAGGWLIVTVAPLAVIASALPLPSTAEGLVIPTGEEVAVVPEAICKVTVASTPLPIAVVLIPATMHRMSPADTRLHVADLPAALAAAPVA